jgi:hypothetical protein
MPGDTFDAHKFIVAFDPDAALTSLSVWVSHPSMRPSLEKDHIFDAAPDAHAALAALVGRADEDGPCCEPGQECGRCVNWPPKVYEVEVSITHVTP